MKTEVAVEKFIASIRDSFIGSQQVYTEGSCYHLYLILKSVFPSAKPYYNTYHIITKIDNKFYDITGEVKESSDMLHMITSPDYNLKVPYNIYKDINR